MSDEEDQKHGEIVNENTKAIRKLRDLTEDLEQVVEHEQRIVKKPPESKPPA
jgi:hypothetical protein